MFVICQAACLAASLNEVMVLKIHLKDGSAVTYELGEDAMIQFENASMYFSSRNYKFDIPLIDISLWTYAREQSSLWEYRIRWHQNKPARRRNIYLRS